ncbi:MAG: head-tail connector protein [Paraclostridium sp.]
MLNELQISPQDITLEIVKNYLRIDHNLDDVELTMCFQSAYAYVRKFLGMDATEEMEVDLSLPILSLTCHFYETKDINHSTNEKMDEIFRTVLSMNRTSIL